MDNTTQTVFIIFTALVAVSVLIQASIILTFFLVARRMQKKVMALLDEARVHVLPALATSRNLLEEVAPKAKVISTNVVEITETLRKKSEEVGVVVGDVLDRTRVEASRIDGMVHGTLDQITHATHAVQHGVSVPLRQLSGILNGVRAGLNVLREKDVEPIREAEFESAKGPLI
jgi:hypothetical protein